MSDSFTPNIPGVGSSGKTSGKSKEAQNAALSFELTDWLDTTQRLDRAATPGPWFESPHEDDPVWGAVVTGGVDEHDNDQEPCIEAGTRPDAMFIAHARTTLPAATAAIRAVAELHKPDDGGHCTECIIGHDGDSFTAGAPVHDAWPCATIQAIQQRLT